MNKFQLFPVLTFFVLSILSLIGCESTNKNSGSMSQDAKSQKPSLGVCPQDAKMCPDGSAVSRSGPNCTFPACK